MQGLLGATRPTKGAVEREHQRALEQMAEGDRAEAALRQIQRVEAVSQLTGGAAHDVNDRATRAAVTGMQDLLKRALGRRVQMDVRLADDLWPAMVDPMLELVILSRAINARDTKQSAELVTIEAGNRHRGPPARVKEPTAGNPRHRNRHDPGSVGEGM